MNQRVMIHEAEEVIQMSIEAASLLVLHPHGYLWAFVCILEPLTYLKASSFYFEPVMEH